MTACSLTRTTDTAVASFPAVQQLPDGCGEGDLPPSTGVVGEILSDDFTLLTMSSLS